MFAQPSHPIIFAHRGASAHAPENTIAAFLLALQQGADGIELDAKLTADGHVVVIHDQTVDRTTKISGKVGDMPLEALLELDAGSHFDVAFKGEPIPTLEQVLERIGPDVLINIELSNYASPFDDLPEKVAALVKRYHTTDRVLFSSFNPLALRRVQRLLPDVPVGLLALSGRKGFLARGRFGRLLISYQSLHVGLEDVTATLIERVHQNKKKIFAYTVNQASDMFRLFDQEVDGIYTDDPSLARRVIDSIQESRSHRWGHPA
jgi:glycerophosphoryl diester phosphodiesterase